MLNTASRRAIALLLTSLVGALLPFAVATSTAGAASKPTYQAIDPVRLLDTRTPNSGGALHARRSRALRVGGTNGVPTTAAAVVINLTVTQPDSDGGFATVFPCGSAVPTASNLNFSGGETVANAVVTGMSRGGDICIYSNRLAHFVVDLAGYFEAGAINSQTPERVLDTRREGGLGTTALGGSTIKVHIGGANGIPSTAKAASINLTSVGAQNTGYATVWRCDRRRPFASNLNYSVGPAVANAVVTELAADGSFCLFANTPTNLIVDVNGWFPTGTDFVGRTPVRVHDTRMTSGAATGTSIIQVTGENGIPFGATAALLNLTITEATGSGYATAYPCGATRPKTSTVNFSAGDTRANLVLTKLSPTGSVCVFSSAPVEVIVDLSGHFPAVPGQSGGPGSTTTTTTTSRPTTTTTTTTTRPGDPTTTTTTTKPDTTKPAISFDLGSGGSTFSGPVSVAIVASDAGGSGLSTVTYRIDGGPVTIYDHTVSPAQRFTVSGAGSHTVTSTAKDVAGNTATASVTFTIETPVNAPDIDSTTFLTQFSIDQRLAFSTVNRAPDTNSVTIRNVGSQTLNVTNLAINGPNPGAFNLQGSSGSTFSLSPNATRTLDLRFAPPDTGTAPAIFNANLVLTSNDPDEGSFTVALAGVNQSRKFECCSEPSLQEILDIIGFDVDTGFNGNFEAMDPRTYGPDEISSPYFVRADPSKPVEFIPIARYVAPAFRECCPNTGDTGTTVFNVRSPEFQYNFPNDVPDTPDCETRPVLDPSTGQPTGETEQVDPSCTETNDSSVFVQNQKLFPKIGHGNTAFNRNSEFGLYSNFNAYSDDRFNQSPNECTAQNTTVVRGKPLQSVYRNMRVYPARDNSGTLIPDAYIVGTDIKTREYDSESGTCVQSKNFDYQDQVHLLLNARATTGIVAPNPGVPSLDLDFSTTRGGVLDKFGQGTGFDSVQPNKDGSAYDASKIDLKTSTGTLSITSTAGKNSGNGGTSNNQNNALEKAFNATVGTFTIEARLIDPDGDFTGPFQQKAVYFGPGQNDYVKLEIERRKNDTSGPCQGNNITCMTLFREIGGATSSPPSSKAKVTVNVNTLDLQLQGNPSTGDVVAKYRINDGSWVTLDTYRVPVNSRDAFFTANARGGILTSHTGTTQSVVAVYDHFKIF